jgi:hypothetical protein
MAWTLNSIRIYANKHDAKQSKVIARLQPLDGSTILHSLGHDNEIVSLGGLVVTSGDMDSLKALVDTEVSYALVGPEGALGNYYIKDLAYNRTPIVNICIFDRPEIPSSAPVYDVSMELYVDN